MCNPIFCNDDLKLDGLYDLILGICCEKYPMDCITLLLVNMGVYALFFLVYLNSRSHVFKKKKKIAKLLLLPSRGAHNSGVRTTGHSLRGQVQ